MNQGQLQLSLFDQHNLAKIAADDYPAERLIVCCNPLVAGERQRKREELHAATERAREEIARRVEQEARPRSASPLAAWNRRRVRKHFAVEISDPSVS